MSGEGASARVSVRTAGELLKNIGLLIWMLGVTSFTRKSVMSPCSSFWKAVPYINIAKKLLAASSVHKSVSEGCFAWVLPNPYIAPRFKLQTLATRSLSSDKASLSSAYTRLNPLAADASLRRWECQTRETKCTAEDAFGKGCGPHRLLHVGLDLGLEAFESLQ